MDERIRALIIGSGGREHALAVHLLASERVEHVFVAPGNGGTAILDRCTNVDSPKASGDYAAIAQFAVEQSVSVCIPGPEKPLVEGIERAFRRVGIPVFGPSPEAAQMEGSKAFARAFTARHGIPAPEFGVFTPEQEGACLEFIGKLGGARRVVLKADGLAGGKGVLLPETDAECTRSVHEILQERAFGDAGLTLVVEERLEGSELSVLAFSDGYTLRALPGCQDHKRIGEGDTGGNTGGMGAYCPTPDGGTPEMEARILREVLEPTISGMRHDGFPFVGLLFVGLMLTADGPKVLEYNVRFGDPEAEAALMLLAPSSPLADLVMACVQRRLDAVPFDLRRGHAVSVVLASGGYPGKYATGVPVALGQMPPQVTLYHAGTTLGADGTLRTSGGRVLVVAAQGATLQEAIARAYEGVDQVHFDGLYVRRDIAHRALRPAGGGAAGLTYADAGVDIDAGNALVQRIKQHARSTERPGCLGGLGGFGGLFALGEQKAGDPVLVACTDGVGTKLRVALELRRHDTVGRDLVAMSVNDLLAQGALPLFFLDYYACSRLEVDTAEAVVAGIADGCRQARCALLGGETAEMPGMYAPGEYDLAGFAVGAVDRAKLLPRLEAMRADDQLIGLRSSGPHSNGYSLLRKLAQRDGRTLHDACPWGAPGEVVDGYTTPATLGEALLEPTRIYVEALAPLLAEAPECVHGIAHITGGGLLENVPRMLPAHLGARIDVGAWALPPVFRWARRAGNMALEELARTFNNGIGMVLVVPGAAVGRVTELLQRAGEEPVRLGDLSSAQQHAVELVNLDRWQ